MLLLSRYLKEVEKWVKGDQWKAGDLTHLFSYVLSYIIYIKCFTNTESVSHMFHFINKAVMYFLATRWCQSFKDEAVFIWNSAGTQLNLTNQCKMHINAFYLELDLGLWLLLYNLQHGSLTTIYTFNAVEKSHILSKV